MDRSARQVGIVLLGILLAAGLAACDDTTGPEGSGTATVQMNRLGGGAQVLALHVLASDARLASVPLDSVEAINVEIDTVEAHRIDSGSDPDADDETPGGWIAIGVTIGELDLLSLSTEQTLTIAEGSLPAGSYNQLRFFFTGATVDFHPDFDPDGEGDAFDAGATDVPLVIPSGDQTGIKVPGAAFDLEADEEVEVTVSFDDGASVQTVTVTGAGEVMMNPVLVPEGGPPAGT